MVAEELEAQPFERAQRLFHGPVRDKVLLVVAMTGLGDVGQAMIAGQHQDAKPGSRHQARPARSRRTPTEARWRRSNLVALSHASGAGFAIRFLRLTVRPSREMAGRRPIIIAISRGLSRDSDGRRSRLPVQSALMFNGGVHA
jgi:hypothetical protein